MRNSVWVKEMIKFIPHRCGIVISLEKHFFKRYDLFERMTHEWHDGCRAAFYMKNQELWQTGIAKYRRGEET